jgi:hypothetical protein
MLRSYTLAVVALVLVSGCADIAAPRIFHPGSEDYQQSRAERFDPYPEPDVAPDIVGGRPLQYIKPAAVPERLQNEMSFEERFHAIPPPGMFRPPRSAGHRQGIVYPLPGVPPLAAPAPGVAPPVVELGPAASRPFAPQ